MLVYHGSPEPDFKPFYGGGREYHDYGKGLYCVEDETAAKEWACQHVGIGTSYVYSYDLDFIGLSPKLDLNEYAPIYWISALAQHRYSASESHVRRKRRLRLIECFPVNCENYELIRGWRANDRYFAFLNSFIGLDISYEAVVQAMMLGDLGQQVVIKGKEAYNRLVQVDRVAVGEAEYTKYRDSYLARDLSAKSALRQVLDVPGRMLDEIISDPKGVLAK